MEEEKFEELSERLEQMKEDLFLAKTDLENARVENISLKGFIQNLYDSCEELEEETNLELDAVLKNLKENIRQFCKQQNIKL